MNMLYRYMSLTSEDAGDLCKISRMDNDGVREYVRSLSPLKNSLEHKLLNLIMEGRTRLSKSVYFNDPYDCFPRVDRSISNNNLCLYLNKELRQNKYTDCIHNVKGLEHIQEDCRSYLNNPDNKERAIKLLECLYRQLAAKVKILCFSKEFDNFPMWAHYADNHKGFCIGVDRSKINDLNINDVNYSENRPEIRFADDTRNTGHEFTDKVILTKSRDWAYEKEVRCYAYHGKEDCLIFREEAIKCIILGSEMRKPHKEAIHKLVTQANENPLTDIQTREAYLDDVKYMLNVRLYHPR